MKLHFAASLFLLLFLFSVSPARAQDETRNKLELSITYGGKTVTAPVII